MAALPATGISELVLEARDLDASVRFYGELLGLEETRHGERREDRRWFLVGQGARLGVWTEQEGIAGSRGGSHVHFAMHVPDERIDELAGQLRERGVEVEGPIQLGPGRALYATDPDGNVVELWSQDMAEYARGARESEVADVLPENENGAGASRPAS